MKIRRQLFDSSSRQTDRQLDRQIGRQALPLFRAREVTFWHYGHVNRSFYLLTYKGKSITSLADVIKSRRCTAISLPTLLLNTAASKIWLAYLYNLPMNSDNWKCVNYICMLNFTGWSSIQRRKKNKKKMLFNYLISSFPEFVATRQNVSRYRCAEISRKCFVNIIYFDIIKYGSNIFD